MQNEETIYQVIAEGKTNYWNIIKKLYAKVSIIIPRLLQALTPNKAVLRFCQSPAHRNQTHRKKHNQAICELYRRTWRLY
jgi:hypothetical protein